MSNWMAYDRRARGLVPIGVLTLTALTLFGGAAAGSPVSAASKQTITFAESGLGSEGAQTQKAINDFQKANPNIKVNILVLSPNSTTYLQQLEDPSSPAPAAPTSWSRT
ncbi:MAG: hypothetical protein WB116_01195 [Candidatus Dormiibacterota bacterium]